MLGLASILGLFSVGNPQAAAQTLTQALAETYNTNPQLLAQRALLRATDESVPQALAGWRPTVNFTGQLGGARASFAEPPLRTQHTTYYNNLLNLQVSQPVYSGGRTLAQTRQAMNTVEFDPGADPGDRNLGVPSGGDGLS